MWVKDYVKYLAMFFYRRRLGCLQINLSIYLRDVGVVSLAITLFSEEKKPYFLDLKNEYFSISSYKDLFLRRSV